MPSPRAPQAVAKQAPRERKSMPKCRASSLRCGGPACKSAGVIGPASMRRNASGARMSAGAKRVRRPRGHQIMSRGGAAEHDAAAQLGMLVQTLALHANAWADIRTHASHAHTHDRGSMSRCRNCGRACRCNACCRWALCRGARRMGACGQRACARGVCRRAGRTRRGHVGVSLGGERYTPGPQCREHARERGVPQKPQQR